jgi:hypothetical protein
MARRSFDGKARQSGFRYVLDAAVMAILGFFGISCSDGFRPFDLIDGGMRLMYGCPTSVYHVKGTVVDENDKPIKGIKIVGSQYAADTLYTDRNGSVKDEFNSLNGTLMYFVEDVDGPDNGGKFASDTIFREDFELKSLKTDYKKNSFGETTYEATFKKVLKKE